MKKVRFITVAAALCSFLALLGFCAAGCAPRLSATDSDKSQQQKEVAVGFSWTPDSNCALCHAVESSSFESESSLARTHAGDDLACAQCHSDTQALESVHEGATPVTGSAVTKLKKSKVTESVCLSCHDQDRLVESTASSMALADEEGTVINPHAIPDSEKHADITCGSCHNMHGANPNASSAAYKLCGSCHHKNIYRSCNSCHEV